MAANKLKRCCSRESLSARDFLNSPYVSSFYVCLCTNMGLCVYGSVSPHTSSGRCCAVAVAVSQVFSPTGGRNSSLPISWITSKIHSGGVSMPRKRRSIGYGRNISRFISLLALLNYDIQVYRVFRSFHIWSKIIFFEYLTLSFFSCLCLLLFIKNKNRMIDIRIQVRKSQVRIL